MWLIYISCILFLLYAALIIFYRWGWVSMPEFELGQKPVGSYTKTVSVIIPARNETINIANCVRSVLAQSYPSSLIEIIVVDDHSDDDTAEIANALAQAYTNVHLIKLEEADANLSYKKRGIEAGIAHATGSFIITTDADCAHTTQWIETLVQYQEQTRAQLIAAPVGYITENKLLSVFQCLDFMTMQGITGASVYKRFHTMCNGANLLYTKAAFIAVNGFAGIDALPTGDDMLLMYKIHKQYPGEIAYLKSKSAIVSTQPAYSWKAFFNQRIRWASKASHYDDHRIFATLLLVYLFNVCLLAVAITALFVSKYPAFLLGLLAAKTLIELWFLKPVANFFYMAKWLSWFPFLQPIHILYVVISGWLGKFGKYEWKGREIRQRKKV